MRSIVISGPPAVGKTTVALALASKFGMRHVSGGDVLKEIAQRSGSTGGGDDWWDRPEGMAFLEQRMHDDKFDREVDGRLAEIFDAGGAVITSYTLPWLVKDGTKIWLAGSHESSARRMRTRDSMDHDEALAVTQRRYRSNVALYKRLYGFDFGEDLSVFDSVIQTDSLDADAVIKAAVRAVEAHA